MAKSPKTKAKNDTHSAMIEETIDLAAETLTGDIQGFLLDRIRRLAKPWAAMSEEEQQIQIDAAKSAAENLVRKCAQTIASEGRKAMVDTLESVTVKDGIKAVLKLSKMDESRHDLMDAQGQSIVVIVADVEAFEGSREEIKPDPDQKELIADDNESDKNPFESDEEDAA